MGVPVDVPKHAAESVTGKLILNFLGFIFIGLDLLHPSLKGALASTVSMTPSKFPPFFVIVQFVEKSIFILKEDETAAEGKTFIEYFFPGPTVSVDGKSVSPIIAT